MKRAESGSSRPEETGGRLDALCEALRGECAAAPPAPGFLAGFRTRREAWLDRADPAVAWRLLALRMSPVGALAAGAALVVTFGGGRSTAPDAVPETPATAEYPDPFLAGLEEVGVAAAATGADDAGHELLAVLYEPMGTR